MPSSNQKLRKRLVFCAKIIVGIALIGALLSRINLAALRAALLAIPIHNWFLSVSLMLLGVVISSVKLMWLLQAYQVRVSPGRLFVIYMISTFWNNFLPGAVGGDIIKFQAIQEHAPHRMDIAISIFAERYTGMIALLAVCAAAVIENKELFPNRLIPFGVCFLAGLALLSLVIFKFFLIKKIFILGSRGRIGSFLRRAQSASETLATQDRIMLLSLLASLAFVFTCIFAFSALAGGLGQNVQFSKIAAASCLIILAMWLPISLNGLGVREWSCIFFFGLCGIPPEKSLAVSLLIYAASLAVSLLGGIMFIFDRQARAKSQTP